MSTVAHSCFPGSLVRKVLATYPGAQAALDVEVGGRKAAFC